MIRVEEAVKPGPGLSRALLDESDVNVNACFQCGRCAVGCPVAYAMDYPPAQLIHAIRLGMDDLVLSARTTWLCASCETCTTRCPQDVDIAKVMDAVKILAVRRKIDPPLPTVRAFHKAVLANLKLFGRMWEAGMIASLKVRTGNYTKDIDLGLRMVKRRKLRLLPTFSGARRMRKILSRVRKLEKEARRPS